jgi:hypothetical protein
MPSRHSTGACDETWADMTPEETSMNRGASREPQVRRNQTVPQES